MFGTAEIDSGIVENAEVDVWEAVTAVINSGVVVDAEVDGCVVETAVNGSGVVVAMSHRGMVVLLQSHIMQERCADIAIRCRVAHNGWQVGTSIIQYW